MKRVSKGFWKVVKRICKENYSLLETERLRQGYYIVRDKLAALIGDEISKEDFDFFARSKDGGYGYYSMDMWVQLEREGLKRPEAKPVGSLWTHQGKLPIEDFYAVWSQARGFIFTEKSGEKLEPLTMFGWMIIEPEKGFPTRLIRKQCKEDGRPVLAIHDADKSGEGISRALGHETVRTTHLDIAIDDVTDLGLRWEDVQRLNLPTQPEVKKHRNERSERCELESMTVLKSRHGIKNPFLEYVILRMIQENIKVCPTEIDKWLLFKASVVARITSLLEGSVAEGVDNFVEEKENEWLEEHKDEADKAGWVKPEMAVAASVPFPKRGDDGELEEKITDMAFEITSLLEEKTTWQSEADVEEKAHNKVSKKFFELMGGASDGNK